MDKMVLRGNIAFTPSKEKFEIHEDSYILVEDGKVVDISKYLDES